MNQKLDSEKLAALMGDSRLVSAADNILYPLIQLKIKQRIDMACARFIGGELNFVGDIAYIQGLKEIEQQLRKIQAAGNQVIYDLNKDQL